MNCKPGDLARVISNEQTRFVGIEDRILVVTEIIEHAPDGVPIWGYEGPRMQCACHFLCRRPIEGVGDPLLRPIRDQDGDDEMLALAGKPADIKTPVVA